MKPLPHHPNPGSVIALVATLETTICPAAEPPWQPASTNRNKFPAVAQLPAQAGLPDTLLMLDGRRISTSEHWFKERRPELIALFQHKMCGTPPHRPAKVSGKNERVDRNALGGKATLHHNAFDPHDAGAAAQLGLLYDFFATLPFRRMQPFDGVTCAQAIAQVEPGKFYAVYLPHGGTISVNLSTAKETLTAQWFNPRDGRSAAPIEVKSSMSHQFEALDGEDWVLKLRPSAK